jgi:hypothetical protein
MLSLSLSLFYYTGNIGRSGQADRFFGHYAVVFGNIVHGVLAPMLAETNDFSIAGRSSVSLRR